MTCVTFVWFSAPDLAATQLVVEIVTTVLILLGLRWLPKRSEALVEPSGVLARLRRFRDLSLAVVAGAGMTAISYAVMTRTPPDTIADFFIEKAYSEGGGRNVVNVILVDFRGFDTLGEITVLGIVALTVFALLRRFRPAPDSIERPEQQHIQRSYDEAEPDREAGATAAEYLYVPSVIMQWMFPVVIVLAAYLFLRGHDAPGGGFVAGVAMAAGFILQYMAAGHGLGGGQAAHPAGRLDRRRPAAGRLDRGGLDAARRSFPHVVFPVCRVAAHREGPAGERDPLRPRRLQSRRRRHGADADRHRPPVDPPPARRPH